MTTNPVIVLLAYLFIGWAHMGNSQNIEIAGKLVEEGRYLEATKIYDRLPAGEISSEDLLNKATAYYFTNRTSEAYANLTRLKGNGYTGGTFHYLMARIAHDSLKFAIAGLHYKEFLRVVSEDRRSEVIRRIKQCAQGMKTLGDKRLAFVEPFGSEINTAYDEKGAVVQFGEVERMYFTSNRPGILFDGNPSPDRKWIEPDENIYFLQTDEDGRRSVFAYDPGINSSFNESTLDILESDSVLYFSREIRPGVKTIHRDFPLQQSSNHEGIHQFSTIMDALAGDDYLHILSDGSILFSSKRSGGAGGYDIYFSRNVNGSLQQAHNLGLKINSPNDEICPFVSRDGDYLYFSSNSNLSIGGFDVFVSRFDEGKGEWGAPRNLCLPINSPGDELYFRLLEKRSGAIFSSGRTTGFGGFDLYTSYFHGDNDILPVAGESSQTELKSSFSDKLPAVEKQDAVDFELRTIYSPDMQLAMDRESVEYLKELGEWITSKPAHSLVLNSFVRPVGNSGLELYSSAKMGEQLADLLISLGVPPKQLAINGYGAQYEQISGSISCQHAGVPSNNKIEIRISGIEHGDIAFHHVDEIPEHCRVKIPSLLDASIAGFSYRVEFHESSSPFEGDLLSICEDLMVERDLISRTNRYTAGLYNDYNSARLLAEKLKKRGITDPKVITYVDGKRYR